MPATPTRMQFIRQQFRSVSNGPVTSVVTAFGDLARRTREPIETFFEHADDAQDMCDERVTLQSAQRRRIAVQVSGEATGLGIAYTATSPTATIIDDDRLINKSALISEFSVDFGKETTQLELWG